MPKKKFNKLLLVEGNDDQHVIWALCQKFDVVHNFDVIDSKGISNLFKQIPLRIKQADIDTIGIIIDADLDIKKRWEELKRIFIKIFPSFPEDLPSEGLIFKENDFRIGIWIMPNNNLKGMLEDFIKFLIPNEDLLMPKVQNHLDNVEKKGLQKYKPASRSKSEISSWLALQEEPGTPMGLSITRKFLSIENEECDNLINWLKELFKK